MCVEINLVYILLCLSCQHSFNVFEKRVSLIQGPSSLAGQSCYLSADFDGGCFKSYDGPRLRANKGFKVFLTALSREACGVGKI